MITYIGSVIPISSGMFLGFVLDSFSFLVALLLENLDHEILNKRKKIIMIKMFKTINLNHPRPKILTMTLDSILKFGVARYVVDMSNIREHIRSMNITRYKERVDFLGESESMQFFSFLNIQFSPGYIHSSSDLQRLR